MTPLISLQALTKTYTVGEVAVHALRGISLDIQAGEFVSIVGPSGSGKSTCMHILGCLDRPTTARICSKAKTCRACRETNFARVRNHKIGFVFQSFNLLPRTSALENVELPMLYYTGTKVPPAERHRRAVAALSSVGLENRMDHYPNQLSGGQQQRVAIARALMTEPPILLADEPTGNLDSRTSVEVMEIFQRLGRAGITVILITHDHDVAQHGSRVVSFTDGHIISDTTNTSWRAASTELADMPLVAADAMGWQRPSATAWHASTQRPAVVPDVARHHHRCRRGVDDGGGGERCEGIHRRSGGRCRHERHHGDRGQLQDEGRGRWRRRRSPGGLREDIRLAPSATGPRLQYRDGRFAALARRRRHQRASGVACCRSTSTIRSTCTRPVSTPGARVHGCSSRSIPKTIPMEKHDHPTSRSPRRLRRTGAPLPR